MKIKRLDYLERRALKEKWHRWFAWHPVRLNSTTLVWLVPVFRKGKYDCSWGDCHWDWKYREYNVFEGLQLENEPEPEFPNRPRRPPAPPAPPAPPQPVNPPRAK